MLSSDKVHRFKQHMKQYVATKYVRHTISPIAISLKTLPPAI